MKPNFLQVVLLTAYLTGCTTLSSQDYHKLNRGEPVVKQKYTYCKIPGSDLIYQSAKEDFACPNAEYFGEILNSEELGSADRDGDGHITQKEASEALRENLENYL